MKEINITTGSYELLGRVETLWKELNEFHIGIGGYFSADLAERSFDRRRTELIDSTKMLYVAIASDNADVGYCISSIRGDDIGEIDSIYVKKEYRSQGLGKKLAESALRWLDENNVRKKVVVVLEGNSEAMAFYRSLGFLPRNVELEYIN